MAGNIHPRDRFRSRALTFGLLFALSCNQGAGSGCGGAGGCAGCGDGTYQFPADDPSRPDAKILGNAARVRITQSLLDFIRPRIPALLVEALGSAGQQQGFSFRIDQDRVLHVAIPDQNGLLDFGAFAQVSLHNGEVLLWLDDIEQKLQVDFEPPNGIRIKMENLRVGVSIDLDGSLAGADSSCPVFGTLGMGPVKHAAEISLTVLVEPGVGPDPDRKLDVDVTIDDIELNGLEIGAASDCNRFACRDCTLCNIFDNGECNPPDPSYNGPLQGCGDPGGRCGECKTLCDDIADNLLQVVTQLIDTLKGLLNRLLKPVIQNFVRSALEQINDQPAKLEMQLSVAELTGFPMFKNANPLGLLLGPEPGKFPVVNRQTVTPTVSPVGMEITAAAGAEAEIADCIPTPPPFTESVGPVPLPTGVDSQGRPYHVWATLSEALFNEALYAVHRSGTLCLKITTADVRQLTNGMFTLNASLLSLLASDLSKLAKDKAPVILQVKPKDPPRVTLGSGKVTGTTPDGKDIIDPLLALRVKDLGLAFHVFMHDRYVRVFEVSMDVNVGLNVVVQPNNVLELAVTELRIDDFVEEFNEILPNADFGDVLPALLDIALQALITTELKFDVDLSQQLSTALGGLPLGMRVNDIQRDGVNEDFLTLSLTFTDPMVTSLPVVADTRVELREIEPIEAPAKRRFVANVPDANLEYQVRVDGGLWSDFRRPNGTELALDHPRLVLPGQHKIEVRARYVGDYQTLDPSPAELVVGVDSVPPSLSLQKTDQGFRVRVTDDQTAPADLRIVMYGADGRELARLTPYVDADDPDFATLVLPDVLAGETTFVSVEDQSKNLSARVPVVRDVVAAADPKGPFSCAAAKGDGLAVLGMIGLFLAFRRRR